MEFDKIRNGLLDVVSFRENHVEKTSWIIIHKCDYCVEGK